MLETLHILSSWDIHAPVLFSKDCIIGLSINCRIDSGSIMGIPNDIPPIGFRASEAGADVLWDVVSWFAAVVAAVCGEVEAGAEEGADVEEADSGLGEEEAFLGCERTT